MLLHKAAQTGCDYNPETTPVAVQFICISLTDDVSSTGYTASNDSIVQIGRKGCGCGLVYCTIPSSAGNTEENYSNTGYLDILPLISTGPVPNTSEKQLCLPTCYITRGVQFQLSTSLHRRNRVWLLLRKDEYHANIDSAH